MDQTSTTNPTQVDDEQLNQMIANLNGGGAPATPPVSPSPTVTPDPTLMTPAAPTVDATVAPTVEPTALADATDNPELDAIKKDAISELRPLVDKLDLPADEKFNTLLLIIRSTDDKSLIGAASAVAKQITDDTKRAQALLDIIKEIDYFNKTK